MDPVLGAPDAHFCANTDFGHTPRPFRATNDWNSRFPRPDNIPPPPGQQHTIQRIHFDAMHNGQVHAAYGYSTIEQDSSWSPSQPLTAPLIPVEVTEPASRRQPRVPRTMNACEACRAVKAKCTDFKPCKLCTERNIECRYQRPELKKSQLEERLERLETKMDERFDDLDSKLQLVLNALTVCVKPDNTSKTTAAANIYSNESAIPIGHTTGADHILKWPAVADLVGEIYTEDMDSLRCEYRRGTIHLHGRGEEGPPTYVYTPESPNFHSDSFSESSAGGNPSLSAESPLYHNENKLRPGIEISRLPRPDEAVRLTKRYMGDLNVMHPFITKEEAWRLTTDFQNYTHEMERNQSPVIFTNFATNESESSKRKRSSTGATPYHLWPLSMDAAIFFLIVALGTVCEHPGKIPDVLPGHEADSREPSNPCWAPPTAQKLPSPKLQEKQNVDVIPGLALFAIAIHTLDNDTGEKSLQFVHAHLLASLYYSQLGRVLQSHAYVKKAGDALSIILKPHLGRYKEMQERMGNTETARNVMCDPQDNNILITFWTCLQFERLLSSLAGLELQLTVLSDIVAELRVPQSKILSLESRMPWPHLVTAVDNGDATPRQIKCYLGLLALRKHLNNIHRTLYGPYKDKEYQLANFNENQKACPEITVIAEDLQSVVQLSTGLTWQNEDPPSDDILVARFRAKMFGALVVTYRHYLRMVLNNNYSETGVANDNISGHIVELAGRCIQAMIYSTQAFWGIKGDRLTLTNVWGTCHAQWGHVIALHAAYIHPSLQGFINAEELREVTIRVRKFLESVSHPSSALANDIRILDYIAVKSGIFVPT
ncbi:hypothetical protein V495_00184 [Pseudogymnoascus sp. VKM F-4514 (FW-929)]|nr:hypothetical protein V495_00184 [Pseudogymnoascus sp. VKM F-4514 (FW-929)]KFY67302.1 hypothetical protein V497_00415 [Pseudogymnoascus sp. VKM F-4516 (FW-969)]